MTAPGKLVWLFACSCGAQVTLDAELGTNTLVEAVRRMRRAGWRFAEDGSARCPAHGTVCGPAVEPGKEWRPEVST